VHTPAEDKSDNMKDSFHKDLERVSDTFPKYRTKIKFGNIDAKVGKEIIFKPTIENENLYEISNHIGVRVINLAKSEVKLSRVQSPHIAAFIQLNFS
jgi:hypothetical protein